MAKGMISKAARVRPGDRIISDGATMFVSRVTKLQGRKPTQGENLCILAFNSLTARKPQKIHVNSQDLIRIMDRPLTRG